MRGIRRRIGLPVRRRRTRRFGYRRRRGISATRSRVVKLTGTISFTFYTKVGTADGQAAPFSFVASQLPGFWDYRSTYSEFRLLKAQLVIPTNPENQTDPSVVSIMRVPSRAFVEPVAVGGGTAIENRQFLPPYAATTLQQSRWAKLVSPNDTRNTVRFGFYPYTLRWSGRPVGVGPTGGADTTAIAGTLYTEYQSGKRWVSMAFLGPSPNSSTITDDVRFYGPYFMPYGQDGLPTHAPTSDTNPGTVSWTRNVQLTVWCQFRGQK